MFLSSRTFGESVCAKLDMVEDESIGCVRHPHTLNLGKIKNLNFAMTCRVRFKGLDMLLLPLTKGRIAPYLGYRRIKISIGLEVSPKNLDWP